MVLAGVEKLEELRDRTPDQLCNLAQMLTQQRASSEALDNLDAKPKIQHNEQLRQVVMWNRDVLQYIVLDQAIHNGDVGLMEAMLPHLLFRFIGGGNGNYAGEILELLQGLHQEWDSESW